MWRRRKRTHLPGTGVAVAGVLLIARHGVALGQQRHHSGGQLLPLDPAHTVPLAPTFLVVQEHEYIFHAVLEDASAPFYLVEEELRLERAGNLKRSATVVGGDAVCEEEVALDLRLDCRLCTRC